MTRFRGWWQITVLSFALGLVDQINGGIALVEYATGDELIYFEIDLEKSTCTPREGDWVLFDREGITHCGVERSRR